MPTYRAYPIDTDGHIVAPPTIIDAEDDEEAQRWFFRNARRGDIELWQGDRLVVKLSGKANRRKFRPSSE